MVQLELSCVLPSVLMLLCYLFESPFRRLISPDASLGVGAGDDESRWWGNTGEGREYTGERTMVWGHTSKIWDNGHTASTHGLEQAEWEHRKSAARANSREQWYLEVIGGIHLSGQNLESIE